MIRLAQFISTWEALILAVLAPALLFPQSTDGLAMLGVVGIWIARWAATGRIIRRTPLDGPILVMLAMVLVSTQVTFDPGASMPKVVGVVLGVAVFYTMVEKLRSEAAIWWGLSVFILIGCGVAVLGLIGTNWFGKFGPLARIAALLPQTVIPLPGSSADGFHPNQVAGALLWLAPALVALLLGPMPRLHLVGRALPPLLLRAALALALVLIGGVLVLTQSRAAFAGLSAALGVLIWLLFPRARVVIACLAAVGLTALLLIGPSLAARGSAGGEQAAIESSTESLAFRLSLWPCAVEAIADFALTGMGMGAFRQVAQTWYRPLTSPVGQDLGHAHNHILNAGLDLGLLGMLAYLALWAIALALAGAVVRAGRGPWRLVGAGLLSGMVGHFIWGMVDANALGSKPGLLLWMCLGLVVGVYCATRAVLEQADHVSRNASIQANYRA